MSPAAHAVVIDTSALMAMLLQESDAEALQAPLLFKGTGSTGSHFAATDVARALAS